VTTRANVGARVSAKPMLASSAPAPVVSASLPIDRAMARGVGVGGIVFAGLAVPDFLRQFPTISPAWDLVFASIYLATTITLAVVSWASRVPMMRTVARVLAGVYLLGLLTFVLAIPNWAVGQSVDVPWVTTLMVIGTSAAAMSLPATAAWAYLGLCGALIALDRLLYCGLGATLGTVQDTLFELFYCGIFVALAMASRRLGKLLDAAGLAAELETRRIAAHNARTRERRRIDALIHDNVLSVLLASAVGGAESVVGDQARRALRQIERYGVDGVPEPVTAAQLVSELHSITAEIAPGAEFRYEVKGELSPPAEITAALEEAMAEALRNSVLHAAPDAAPHAGDATRAVHLHLDDGGIAIVVMDDGVGFVPEAVPTARLGVSVSIVGRMLGVPGGYAAIESDLGRGTTVRIGWVAP